MPKLNSFTTQEILEKVILPVSAHHAEAIAYFADPGVWKTEENASNTEQHGWTFWLSNLNTNNPEPLITLDKELKYVELERTLSSVVAFALVYDGSEKAYKKFTQGQAEPILSFESFQEIHHLAKSVAHSPEQYQAVIATLIYSDLGKTPQARANATKFGITANDHDDWIDAVLSQERAVINQVIPGFFTIDTPTKDTIQRVANSMKIHFGHVLHIEGGSKMFDKLLISIQQHKVDSTSLDFAFLIQLCDVAASASQGGISGFRPLNNDTYTGYKMVKASIETLHDSQNPQTALNTYLNARAQALGFDPSNPKEALLTRFACFIRLYEPQKAQQFAQIATQNFSAQDWDLLQAQFDLHTGVNTWSRNPTYLPAVLLNLARFQEIDEPLTKKFERITAGMVFVSRVLEHYAKTADTQSSTPLCFNHLAKTAHENPQAFQADLFDASQIEFDTQNNALLTTNAKKPQLIGANH